MVLIFVYMIYRIFLQVRLSRTVADIKQFDHVGICQQKVIFSLSATPTDCSYTKVISVLWLSCGLAALFPTL